MATPTGGEFTASAFAEHWRDAEPQLRRGVVRFGVAQEDVDDLLAEVALRMFRARADRPTLREFVRFAEAVARNIVVKRHAAGRREPTTPLASPDESDSFAELSVEHEVESEALEWRLAIRQALAGGGFDELSAQDRRAVELLLRGPRKGGYTSEERGVIFRARPRLRDVFDELFMGIGLAWMRLRNRFDDLRNPPPVVPALAAFVSAAAIGVFPASHAEVSPAPVRAPGPRVALVSAPPRGAAALPVPDGVTRGAATAGTDAQRPPESEQRPKVRPGVIDASTSARLPASDQPGGAAVIVLGPTPTSDGWVRLEVNCGSTATAVVCDAARAAPR